MEDRARYLLDPVAVVRGTRADPTDDGWDAEAATIELLPPFDERAFRGLGSFSHCIVVYVLDRAAWDGSTVLRRPRGDPDLPEMGIFAQRAKDRPNRLGVSVARIIGIDGPVLRVAGLDAIDGTPVVDIKPWMDGFGPRGGPVVEPAWATDLMRDYWA